MKDTHVARRYAQALFNVALSRESIDIIGSELFQLKSFSDKDKRLISFLEAPQVLTEHKVAIVKTLFTTRLSPALLSFVLLLIEKARINLLAEIGREFEKLLEEYKGLIKARVTTAVDIDGDYPASRNRGALDHVEPQAATAYDGYGVPNLHPGPVLDGVVRG